ncbi:thioredoxin-like [Pelodytes ibericus]
MAMLRVYEECELQEALRNAGRRLVVVYFSSPKCGPCRLTTPFINSLCPEMPDILFITIDVNESPDFVERFKITGIPAFFFFRNCEVVNFFQGASTAYLKNTIDHERFKV